MRNSCYQFVIAFDYKGGMALLQRQASVTRRATPNPRSNRRRWRRMRLAEEKGATINFLSRRYFVNSTQKLSEQYQQQYSRRKPTCGLDTPRRAFINVAHNEQEMAVKENVKVVCFAAPFGSWRGRAVECANIQKLINERYHVRQVVRKHSYPSRWQQQETVLINM